MILPGQSVKVIHNHVGFRPADTLKQVVVPYASGAGHIWGTPILQVIDQNELSKLPLHDPRQHENVFTTAMRLVEDDFGRWWVGDFAAVTRPGVYQAFFGNTPGVPFVIHDHAWSRLIPMLVDYLRVQSCGRDVPGWHAACHLDDGFVRETATYVEASGGWHDAGDFRKWATATSLNAVALLCCHAMWAGRERELGVRDGIFLEEALQGAEYFLGVQNPQTGGVYQNVGGGAESVHDNLDNRLTDNVKQSGDERRIHPGFANPPAKMTALFALFANALKTSDPGLARRCFEAGLRSDAHDAWGGREQAVDLQWRAWALLELSAFHGDESLLDRALAALGRLLDLQVAPNGQPGTSGVFHRDRDRSEFHRKHVGADYPVWVLGRFLERCPHRPEAGRWTEAVRAWADGYAMVFAQRNVFGLLPYALYRKEGTAPDRRYRELPDGHCFRYFLADDPLSGGMTNARFALAAVGLSEAARILDRPELADAGYRLLGWAVGNNPFQLSTVTGVGPYQIAPFSCQIGPIPGGVCNGIGGNRDDLPAFEYHPWSVPCNVAEYYSYNTAHYLWALAALQRVKRNA